MGGLMNYDEVRDRISENRSFLISYIEQFKKIISELRSKLSKDAQDSLGISIDSPVFLKKFMGGGFEGLNEPFTHYLDMVDEFCRGQESPRFYFAWRCT